MHGPPEKRRAARQGGPRSQANFNSADHNRPQSNDQALRAELVETITWAKAETTIAFAFRRALARKAVAR
jgi:hypothetical protein